VVGSWVFWAGCNRGYLNVIKFACDFGPIFPSVDHPDERERLVSGPGTMNKSPQVHAPNAEYSLGLLCSFSGSVVYLRSFVPR
jgi:hypothetical protein